jgi:hypothetical protein
MADRRGDEAQPVSSPDRGPSSERRPLTERMSAAISGGRLARSAQGTGSGGASAVRAPVDSRSPSTTRPRGPRRARLRLVHLDPWSVMKTSFLLSIAFGIVTVVAVAVVWSVLDAAGVWESINSTVSDVVGGESASTFDVQNYVGTSRVLGFTMVVAVADVLLITAIATLSAFLYNLAAALLGGIEVTLAEDER